jgi:mono/diheme cytochrome c family protein
MRSTRAKILAGLTGVVVVVAAALFAWLRNAGDDVAVAPPAGVTAEPAAGVEAAPPAPAPAAEATPALDPLTIARGREVYGTITCAACHAVAGVGNPRNPLDGVGLRLSPERILQLTIAAPEVVAELPAGVVGVKQGYAQLPAADLDALVAYLASLR